MIRKLFLTTLLLGPATVMSAEPWDTTNLTLTQKHIAPRYAQLATSSAELEKRLHGFCASPSDTTLEAARQGFHRTMDDWQGIQHIRFGPIELFLRYNRMQLWPDKHGTGPKQLRRLLADRDPTQLAPDTFRHLSVAVQGLSALERLLFDNGIDSAAFTDNGQPNYRCRLAEAIGHNIAVMTRGTAEEWQGKYLQTVRSATEGNDYFDSSRELSGKLLNNLYTELQAVIDQKLMRPLDESIDQARPRRAESWRSSRSLRNITLNLEAAREMYRVGFAPLLTGNEPLAKRIDTAFVESINLTRVSKYSLYDSVRDPDRRPALDRLRNQVSALKRLVGSELPQAIGLPLGFNSLDGD